MTPQSFAERMKDIKHRSKFNPAAAYDEAMILILRALKLSGFVDGAMIFEKMIGRDT